MTAAKHFNTLSHCYDAVRCQLFSYGDRLRSPLPVLRCRRACARSGEAWVSALRASVGLCAWPVALWRIAGSFRIQARLRNQHCLLDGLCAPHWIYRISRYAWGSSVRFLFFAFYLAWHSRGLSWQRTIVAAWFPTGAWRGFGSSMRRSIFALVAFAPLLDGSLMPMAGEVFLVYGFLDFCLPSCGRR